jgi:hypothetical protein
MSENQITFKYTKNNGRMTDIQGVIKSVALSTAETTIEHGLARTPVGYTVIDKDTDAIVYRSSASNRKNIYLKANKSVNVKVMIF